MSPYCHEVRGSMELTELVSYLDGYLRVAEVPDAPHAINGLQVANAGTVSRLAAAVDLCEATVRMAAEQGADVLLVHHGLFWGGLQPLTGRAHRRVAGLIANNIALYSAHLPLDLHPDVGNNVVLAHQLGVSLRGEFGEEYGERIGRWGEVDVSRVALERQLASLTGRAPRLMAFGPERVRRVGVVTGAAGSMIAQAAAAALSRVGRLDTAGGAWLTISVQLGFVAGALGSALLTLSDRWSARRLIAGCAWLAGLATLGVAFAPGPGGGIALRMLTGAALAGVYPPGMKIVAGWYREGRGLAIGVLVGALTLGSALPQLVRWAVPAEHWRPVLVIAAAAAVVGGLLVLLVPHDGPFAAPAPPFSWRAAPRILADRAVSLANLGYLGHMWELYAMWTW